MCELCVTSLRGANATKQSLLLLRAMDCFDCARNDGANLVGRAIVAYSATASAVFIPPICGEGGAS